MNFTTPKMDGAASTGQQSCNAVLFGRATMNTITGLWKDDTMTHVKDTATNELGLNYVGRGMPRSAVGTASELWQGSGHRDRSRQVLLPREFIAAPFFGPGTQPQDVNTESTFLLDQSQRAPKSQVGLADRKTSYFDAPLIGDVHRSVMLPARSEFNPVGADTRHVFVRRLT